MRSSLLLRLPSLEQLCVRLGAVAYHVELGLNDLLLPVCISSSNVNFHVSLHVHVHDQVRLLFRSRQTGSVLGTNKSESSISRRLSVTDRAGTRNGCKYQPLQISRPRSESVILFSDLEQLTLCISVDDRDMLLASPQEREEHASTPTCLKIINFLAATLSMMRMSQ